MLPKTILFNTEARAKLKAGIDKVADAVKVTLGPKGRNVIIKKQYREPFATKDGVTVAEEVILKDEVENTGAEIIRGVARKSATDAGDGTTTATVLAQYIINEGLEAINAGANPIELKEDIEAAVKAVVAEIKKVAIPITTEGEILQVATIAANGDTVIGELINQAVKQVGKDGIITISPSNSINTKIVLSQGMKIDRGFASGAFINNPNKRTCEFDNPLILIYEKRINSVKDIMPVLEMTAKNGRPLVIFAEAFDDTALATICINTAQQKIRACAIHLPGHSDFRKEILADMAAVTGAIIVSPERDKLKLQDVRMEHLGTLEKITVDKDTTLMVGPEIQKAAIEERAEQLRSQVLNAEGNFELMQHLNERIAKLTGGIAVIHVGGTTDIEIREKKDRVDDAIRATQSALQEGIVAGGGFCLLRAVDTLLDEVDTLLGEVECSRGESIIWNAGKVPLRQICINAGLNGSVDSLNSSPTYGYNVRTKVWGDMFEMGVIDAAKVVRCALENAASVAVMILTSECMLVEEKIEQGVI